MYKVIIDHFDKIQMQIDMLFQMYQYIMNHKIQI